jgi:hypothetical protein
LIAMRGAYHRLYNSQFSGPDVVEPEPVPAPHSLTGRPAAAS